MTTLALIAGMGSLPQAVIAALQERPFVCALDGFVPEAVRPDITFRLERLMPMLRALAEQGVTEVAFAGAVRRPQLDPSLFDAATAQLVPRMLTAMQSGDDGTLREFIAIFEEEGFLVKAVSDLAPALFPGPGLIAGKLTARDESDALRAANIVAALGEVDVGQGACVAQGLCLAVEALPGTDAMLDQVAAMPKLLRPNPAHGRGLLYKGPKPKQDRRIDQPAIGLDTLHKVSAAGLGGIAFEAGSVICLGLDAMQEEAERLGLFLWARPC